jgi:F-type H+-transporting ATPase subunit a
VNGQLSLLAQDTPHWWPPKVGDFFLPGFAYPWVTKFTVMVWIAVAIVLVFFVAGYRKPKVVPGRWQWLTESVYSFGRDGIGQDIIGPDGVRFAPYLVSLLSFIAVMNIFGILPFFQIAPTAHIAIPVALALVSYVLYISVGIQRHGLLKFLKMMAVPPGAPWYMLPLLVPLELLQNFVTQPFTLSVRLFANMFAGHFILLVFTLGGFLLLNAGPVFIKPLSIIAWLLTIAVTFLELLVAVLQAYVFAILNAVYLQRSLAEEH